VTRRTLLGLVVALALATGGAAVANLGLAAPALAQQRLPKKAPPDPISPDAPSALRPFYNALRELQAGNRQRVTILQIGDSHTATDHFSGRLRDLFQQQFGNGGRGLMAAGVPYAYYRPYQESVSQSAGWAVANSFRPDDPGPFGVTGYTMRTWQGSETMSLEAGADGPFDEVEIDYLHQPGGGHVDVTIDGRPAGSIATAGNAQQAATQRFAGRNSQTLVLSTRGDGPVTLLGWNLLRQQRGVVLAAEGFSGATMDILDRFDPQVATWQIRRIDPALIILAFGTNEGFQTTLAAADYADALAARITILRSEAPNAAILVVGPPDAERLPSWCASSVAQKERFRCTPLSKTETANYANLLNARSKQLCHWHVPPNIGVVRDIMRRVAQQQGAYFWDWQKALPGPCGMDAWARAKPPLAHADRVHMQQDGYYRSAELLYNEIMRPYRVK
jgi:lysophospholipase L1-like esterase